MASNVWPTETLNIVDLQLDPLNIRLDHGSAHASQDAIVSDLVENEGALGLALSIARNGLFQHELAIVVKENGKYVVIEGNRRVAALKALLQPGLVPKHSTKLTAASKNNSNLPIKGIDVKVAPSRDAAKPLIAAIHTTESRKPWSRLRQAYFYHAQSKGTVASRKKVIADYPGVDVARFIRMWEMHSLARSIQYDTEEDAEKVQNQQSFPITTFERIYMADTFKSVMGLEFDQFGRVSVKANVTQFKAAIKRIIEDIINEVATSRTLNTSAQLEEYIRSLPAPQVVANSKGKSASAFKPVDRLPRAPRKSKGLAPKDLVCSLNRPSVKRILKELQQLDYRRFPNASHDLLRTFLETSLKAYFSHRNVIVQPKKSYLTLDDVLTKAEDYFPTVKKELVQPIKIIRGSAGNSTANYQYSLDRLNATNHNPSVFSTGEQVKDAWDQMEVIFRYILNP